MILPCQQCYYDGGGVLLLNTKNMIHKVLMKLTSVNMMHNILSQDLTIITPALPQAATGA